MAKKTKRVYLERFVDPLGEVYYIDPKYMFEFMRQHLSWDTLDGVVVDVPDEED